MEGFKNIKENTDKESFEKFKQDDNFVFLSEEELASLNENELSDYYRKLEEKTETDQIEHNSKAPEINSENSEKKSKTIKTEEFDNTENPGYELRGRFDKFKKNKKVKTTNPNRRFNGPKNPLFNPYK